MMLATAFAFIKANRWAQFAIAGALGALAFLIWLAAHDRAVIKRENEALNEAAIEMANEARADANDKQELRDNAFEKSKAELANASDPTAYLERLRAQQDRKRPAPAKR